MTKKDLEQGTTTEISVKRDKKSKVKLKQSKTLIVKVKKTNDKAIIPTKAHQSDAGFDLHALVSTGDPTDLPISFRTIGTGIAMEIPEGYFGLIKPRSGLSTKEGIDVLAGVVDSGYRGEIKVVLQSSHARGVRMISRGEKIAQILILPLPMLRLILLMSFLILNVAKKGLVLPENEQKRFNL